MSECYVYAIGGETGPIKVGISHNPSKRAATIQTCCPFKISVIHQVKFKTRDLARGYEESQHDLARRANRLLHGEWINLPAKHVRTSFYYMSRLAIFNGHHA